MHVGIKKNELRNSTENIKIIVLYQNWNSRYKSTHVFNVLVD